MFVVCSTSNKIVNFEVTLKKHTVYVLMPEDDLSPSSRLHVARVFAFEASSQQLPCIDYSPCQDWLVDTSSNVSNVFIINVLFNNRYTLKCYLDRPINRPSHQEGEKRHLRSFHLINLYILRKWHKCTVFLFIAAEHDLSSITRWLF